MHSANYGCWWGDPCRLKTALSQQLDTAQGDVQATVNGKPGGEGYVLNTPQGNIKLVKRSGSH